MTTPKRLAWIAAGYAGAAAVAAFLVSARYWFIDPAVVSASSGMFAGGDLIFFVLIAGTLSLPSTFFLLRLATDSHPLALAAALLALSATAPLSLWSLNFLGSTPLHLTEPLKQLLGPSLVFVIFPRVVAIPVMLLILATAFLLARERRTRLLLACGFVLEAAPLVLIVIHFARTAPFR